MAIIALKNLQEMLIRWQSVLLVFLQAKVEKENIPLSEKDGPNKDACIYPLIISPFFKQ